MKRVLKPGGKLILVERGLGVWLFDNLTLIKFHQVRLKSWG